LSLIYFEGSLDGALVEQNEVKAKGLLKRAAQKGDIEARVLYI